MNNNKPAVTPATEGKPMTAADQRRWRERFFNTPARREEAEREALGWADPYDDCC